MRKFEFHIFDENAESVGVELHEFEETVQAKAKAGALAKKNGGPVDLARYPIDHTDEWNLRYITTAMPSEYHVKGYRFERLES